MNPLGVACGGFALFGGDSLVWFADALMPDGLRLYAIGDVHGCLGPLSDLHRMIEADLAARPVADWRIIHLGDYVDRGPSSCGVIEFLIRRMTDDSRILCLRGNHDEMFLNALAGDTRTCGVWLANGGGETLASYGVPIAGHGDALRAGHAAREAVPAAHRDFLGGLRTSMRFGDYCFVHAGIEPGRPLSRQRDEAQLWIRAPFLESRQEFELVIVHGHTPVPRVDARPNRIGIDTGAVFGGELSCLVLQDSRKSLLTMTGMVPLPEPAPYEDAQARAGQGGRLGRFLRGLARGG